MCDEDCSVWLSFAEKWKPDYDISQGECPVTPKKDKVHIAANEPPVSPVYDKRDNPMKPARSLRYFDSIAEQEVARFLDSALYKSLEGDWSFKRTREREEQLQGIDCCWSNGDINYNVDEKAAIHYINQDLKTFVMECSFLRVDKTTKEKIPTLGWFLNEELKTDAYLLCYIHADERLYPVVQDKKYMREYFKTLEAEDIEAVYCIFVRKSDIMAYLESQGYSREALIERVKEYREVCETDAGEDVALQGRDFYLKFTRDLPEQPINLVFKRKKMEELAISRYMVHRDGKDSFFVVNV